MKEYLSDKEAKFSRQITNLLNDMPDFFRVYSEYLEDNDCGFSLIYDEIKALNVLCQVIEQCKNYNALKDVSEDDIATVDKNIKLLETYLSYSVKKSCKNRDGKPSDTVQMARWNSYKRFKDYLEK